MLQIGFRDLGFFQNYQIIKLFLKFDISIDVSFQTLIMEVWVSGKISACSLLDECFIVKWFYCFRSSHLEEVPTTLSTNLLAGRFFYYLIVFHEHEVYMLIQIYILFNWNKFKKNNKNMEHQGKKRWSSLKRRSKPQNICY